MIIGVDPGANGALILLEEPDENPTIWWPREYSFKRNSWEEICKTVFRTPITHAYIEAVSAMPRDAARHAFTFGENTGIIKGILYANGISFTEVFSQKWQRHFGLGAKFASKQERKNAHKQKAQELFPNIKVTLTIADALLIAKYGYDKMFS